MKHRKVKLDGEYSTIEKKLEDLPILQGKGICMLTQTFGKQGSLGFVSYICCIQRKLTNSALFGWYLEI